MDLSCRLMRLLPLQWAAIVLIVVDAIVVAFSMTGVRPLPEWWNFVPVPASVALLVLLLVQFRGSLQVDGPWTLLRYLRESVPIWAIALAALAFVGGFLTSSPESTTGDLKSESGRYTITKRKVVKVLTEEQYDAVLTGRQRFYSSTGLMIAGGVLVIAGVVRRIEEENS